MFLSTKKYPHSLGLSAAVRNWRTSSHCRHIHGYSYAFEFRFGALDLDAHNWVVDFGSMKPVREWLQNNFDHRLFIATDDPELATFRDLQERDLCNLNIWPMVGCEGFAISAFGFCKKYLERAGMAPRAALYEVQVWEHEANSAIYSEPEALEQLRASIEG